MACKNICRLCPNLIISQSVTYASGVLTVNIPEGSYQNCCKYCLVIAQAIPADAIIGAPVVITIGDGTVNYPLLRCDGTQLLAGALRTRTKYSTVVQTTSTGGSFRLLGRTCCQPNNNLQSIDGDAPAAVALSATAGKVVATVGKGDK